MWLLGKRSTNSSGAGEGAGVGVDRSLSRASGTRKNFHSLLAGREGALEGGEPGAPGEDYLIPGGEEPGIPGKNTLEIHPTGSPPSAPQGVGMVCLNHAPLNLKCIKI